MMFNGDFNTQFMYHDKRIENFNPISSSLYKSCDDYFDQPYYDVDVGNTRIIWVTNYTNNDDFPIHVPIEDPLIYLRHTSSSLKEQKSIFEKEREEIFLSNNLHTIDLSKLNLDDLLLLLYQLQQKTTARNSMILSNSSVSSSSNSSLSSDSIVHHPSSHHLSRSGFSHTVQSLHPNNRQSSSFTLSNIADVPKQFMPTLTKPITSLHSSNSKHLHSPNDVANQLLQSYHLSNLQKKTFRSSYSSICTYQQSQQHKAKLISNLLANNAYH